MADCALVAEAVKLDETCSAEVLAGLRETPLLQVCKALEPFLTDEDNVPAAMRTLAKASVKRTPLQSTEVALLGSFFAQKAATSVYADVATSCLKTIVEDTMRSGSNQAEIFTAVIDQYLPAIQLQERALAVRRSCFTLLRDVLVRDSVSDAALCTPKRLRIILEALDGEGDPQLVVAMFAIASDVFSWAPATALKDVAEDFFETLASYFPVLFTQPPGCPVTKKDLQKGLSRCLSHPAMSSYCVPFLLGKIVSPSTVVKLDVVQTLRECVERYPPGLLLEQFGGDIVTQLRNEVVKMSAFPDQDGGTSSPNAATPAKVISTSCTVLTAIAQLCDGTNAGFSDDNKVMQLFEPINEGIIHAVSGGAARHTCSAYATMLFSSMIGSWPVCLCSGGYVFTMMVVLSDGDVGEEGGAARAVNSLMVFSALCAGFVDAMEAFAAEDDEAKMLYKNQLCAKLVKTLPAFSEILKKTCNALTFFPGAAPVTTTDDEILVLCQAEFLCSALKLDIRLSPWLDEGALERMVRHLVDAAVLGAPRSVRTRVTHLLSGFVAVDPENKTQQAVQSFLAQRELPAPCQSSATDRTSGDNHTNAMIDLLEELSGASQGFACFALQEVLLPRCSQAGNDSSTLEVPAEEKNRVIVSILDVFDNLDDSTATTMLDKLLAQPQDPNVLPSLCAVFAKTSDEYRADAFTKGDEVDTALVKAALLSCGPGLVPQQAGEASLQLQLLSLFCSVLKAHAFPDPSAWRGVAMNGVTGAVVSSAAADGSNERAVAALEIGQRDAAFVVAFLWGLCIGTPGTTSPTDERDAATKRWSDDLIKDRLRAVLTTTPADEALSALQYFPVLATSTGQRGSLLLPYLALFSDTAENEEATDEPVQQLPLYWKGLLALLANEDVRHIRRGESDLLRALTTVNIAQRPGEENAFRTLFFTLDKKGAAGFLHQALLSHPKLLTTVCAGLGSSSMEERCATLNALSNAAQVAAEESQPPTHVPNPVRRRCLQDARDIVLKETLPVLADKKRLVRQAAGRCRNSWCKVK